MTEQRIERARSSTPSFDGLTPLHLAVLEGSYAKVRKIVSEGEIGVNALSATKTTPLMLAALYGQSDIFLHLLKKKASPGKEDSHGNTAMDYAKPRSAFIQNLLRQYKSIAMKSPDTGRRRDIYVLLYRHQRKMARAKYRAGARAGPRAQSEPQALMNTERHTPQQSSQNPSMGVFLRSLNGRSTIFMTGTLLGTIEHGYLQRACMGFICAAGGNDTPMFAISGWTSAKDKNFAPEKLLDNMEYTRLVKRVAELIGFELDGNSFFDDWFPGTPLEKEGVFWACHSEKQLAVFVLMKAISYVFGTKELTSDNMTALKNQLDRLPPGLSETVIHLDQKRACPNCLRFLGILNQKTGLVFRIELHKWYAQGERPQLRRQADGSFCPVTKATMHFGPNDDVEVIEDELGIFTKDGTVAYDFQSGLADQDGDDIMEQCDVVTPSTPSNHRSGVSRQPRPWVTNDHYRKGSPQDEEPKKDDSRYTTPKVTPRSHKFQALPTPQSHTRLAEISRTTKSPSPAGRPPVFGPENQNYSVSPSMSQEYEVEEIIQEREDNGKPLYLVRWKGFPPSDDTWEPFSNLTNATDAITRFRKKLGEAQSQIENTDA